jgi:hypothetical protein
LKRTSVIDIHLCDGLHSQLSIASSVSDHHLLAVGFPPLYIFFPTYRVLSALVPAELNVPPDVFCDAPTPARLVDCAIYSFNLVPSLFWDDVWEIRGGISVSGEESCRGKTSAGGEW